jgi:two-component system OmpR family response regulator
MSSPHILLVEDDADIRSLVSDFLSQNGFRLSTARDGREMDRLLDHEVDMLILDVMLPKEDGLSICRRVRSKSSLPIIMLTARGSEVERVVGLEMGADDYLAKPFSTLELLARIRALLRRSRPEGPASSPRRGALKFAGWTLDVASRRLLSPEGTRVPLTGGEFDLLVVFCEHPNVLLTREQLLDLTRGRGEAPFDRSIDIQVSRLRRKITAEGATAPLIQTVRAAGYLFTPEVLPT